MGVIRKQVELIGDKGRCMVNALFDAGATYSFVRKDIAQKIATIVSLSQPPTFGTAEAGRQITVNERVSLDFVADGVTLSDEAVVSDAISDEFIIGASTMQKWRIKLDMEREEAIIDPRVTQIMRV